MTNHDSDQVKPEGKPSFFERNHAFWYISTPKIFEWFGWVAVLGALKYLFDKTHSVALLGLLLLGYASLFFYFNGFFEHHSIRFPFVRSRDTHKLVSGAVSALLALAAFLLAQRAVDAFSQAAP
jgi:hypothetical protein